MNWSSRVPARPPRRTTNPYPTRFVAICGECGWIMEYFDMDHATTAAERHMYMRLHEGVEVVRTEEVEL